ncbi:MAG: SGNH/GDSL hydrolase family protein [Planctomycetota bacterium]
MRTTTAVLAVSLSTTAFAQVSDVVFFGDSLSDVGNVNALTLGLLPGANYFDGRFSNGQLFSEYLASDLGLPAPVNSLAGGDNFAFGGAGAAGNNFIGVIPSVENQVADYLGSNVPQGDELFVVWGGSNDIIDGDDDGFNGDAAAAIASSAGDLATAGAQFIAVLNLVPLGQTPRALGTANESVFDDAAIAFNAALAAGLADVRTNHPTVELIEIDVFDAFGDILADPSSFGLTNITDDAQGAGLGFDEADGFLFWDDIHPTTAGHRLLTDEIFAALPASVTGVPEPSVIGVAALGLLLRRRR